MSYQKALFVLVCIVVVVSSNLNQNGKVVNKINGSIKRPLGNMDIQASKTGIQASFKGNNIGTQNHNLAASASLNKQNGKPTTVGGGLSYNHASSGSGASLSGSHTNGGGTNLAFNGNFNAYQSNNGNTKVGVFGNAKQNFGPKVSSKPEIGVSFGNKNNEISASNTKIQASYTGNMINTPNHNLQSNLFANKEYGEPRTLGGGLTYTHVPSGSEVSLTGSNTKGQGTVLGVKGNYNAYTSNNGNAQLTLSGNYNQHFGGPGGRSKPDVVGSLIYKQTFK